jgi:hypothetical protein
VESLCAVDVVASENKSAPDDYIRRKTGIRAAHFLKTLQKQSGAGEQDETERHLHEHERRA